MLKNLLEMAGSIRHYLNHFEDLNLETDFIEAGIQRGLGTIDDEDPKCVYLGVYAYAESEEEDYARECMIALSVRKYRHMILKTLSDSNGNVLLFYVLLLKVQERLNGHIRGLTWAMLNEGEE